MKMRLHWIFLMFCVDVYSSTVSGKIFYLFITFPLITNVNSSRKRNYNHGKKKNLDMLPPPLAVLKSLSPSHINIAKGGRANSLPV